MSSKKIAVVLFGFLAMGGCVQTAQVKDVIANPDPYLAENFTLKNVPDDIRKKLPPVSAPVKVGRVVYIDSDVENQGQDGKTYNVGRAHSFTYLGDGIFLTSSESSRNDIPFGRTYSLNYQGDLPLRSQHHQHSSTPTNLMMEIKEIVHADALPPAAGQKSAHEFPMGTTAQVANFYKNRLECVAGQPYPASKFGATLSGNAIPLECVFYGSSDTVQSRSTRVYLQDYGFSYLTGVTTPSFVEKVTVKRVRVGN